MDARDIKSGSARVEIEKRVKDIYENLSIQQFWELKNIAVLLDNFDEIGINNKYKPRFLRELLDVADYTYVTCHTSYNYVSSELAELDEHSRVVLLGFGNKKREEIVQRWISVGIEESISETELYTRCDELVNNLNIVIKKNIVPPKPIFVLMLLQVFEASSKLDLDLTSYGHCYQQLIYQSFDKAKIEKRDFDKYLNVLTELSWKIFINQGNLNWHQLDKFFDEYSDTYLPVNQQLVLNRLIGHSILTNLGSEIGFKYPYIYYFFVGKKIAESYSDSPKTREKVEDLLSNLHREDFANILIFITHHTKEPWVLNNIQSVLAGLFPEQKEASLDKEQLSFMDDFMRAIPELIMEQREIQKERDAHNEELDRHEREFNEEPTESADTFARINKTFKGMELAGQIIRNRHATLTRKSMEDLVTAGASAGFRFLDYFIEISDSAKNEIINLISHNLSEHPNLTDKEIEKEAEHVYLHMTYGFINSFVRKVASSIGSREALDVYKKVDENSGSPAFNLVRQAIELQFNKNLDTRVIAQCVKNLKGNEVCLRILKEIVIQHIYMFPVHYREKQQLSELLGISVKGQRWMDIRKAGK